MQSVAFSVPEGYRFRRGWFGRMILQVRRERLDVDLWHLETVWVDADVMDAVDFALAIEEAK